MNVPFGDLTREVKEIREPVNNAISRVIESGWFVLGPEVEAFEEEFSRWLEIMDHVQNRRFDQVPATQLAVMGVKHSTRVETRFTLDPDTVVRVTTAGVDRRLLSVVVEDAVGNVVYEYEPQELKVGETENES